jgi:hypothetical protein
VANGSDCIYGSSTYGQCKNGRCGCGNLNEPCCPSTSILSANLCSSPTLACNGSYYSPGTCVTCGTAGNPCCTGNKCTGTGLECNYDSLNDNYVCQSCGELGQACCNSTLSTTACNNPAAVCDTYSSYNGICALCGSAGGPCCTGSICTDANTVCSSSRCVKCGTTGTQCCGGNQCTSGCCVSYYSSFSSPTCTATGSVCDTYYSASGPTCAAGGSCQGTGTATPCGAIGQRCCTSSTYPSISSYNYCGAPGSRCTYTSSTLGYNCTACGDKGQVCCSDSTSSATSCKSPYKCLLSYSGTSYVYMCTDSSSTSTSITTAIH